MRSATTADNASAPPTRLILYMICSLSIPFAVLEPASLSGELAQNPAQGRSFSQQ
jgi:hypothetical protein